MFSGIGADALFGGGSGESDLSLAAAAGIQQGRGAIGGVGIADAVQREISAHAGDEAAMTIAAASSPPTSGRCSRPSLDRLTGVLERETALVRAARSPEIAPLQSREDRGSPRVMPRRYQGGPGATPTGTPCCRSRSASSFRRAVAASPRSRRRTRGLAHRRRGHPPAAGDGRRIRGSAADARQRLHRRLTPARAPPLAVASTGGSRPREGTMSLTSLSLRAQRAASRAGQPVTISANIANAQTPGYSRETLPQMTQVLGTQGVAACSPACRSASATRC